MVETQSRLRKESRNIVFDGLKPDNSWCRNDYMSSLLSWCKLLAIPGLGMKIGMDEESKSFVSAALGPANQERDDHVILIKNYQPPQSNRVLKEITFQLIADFGDEKSDQLIYEIQKKNIVTQITKLRKKQKSFDRISKINHDGASSSQKLKVEAFTLLHFTSVIAHRTVT